MKVKWEVKLEDGYAKVYHSQRGLICAGLWNGKTVTDIAFLNEENRKKNMIRMPAMSALENWIYKQVTQ